MISVLINSAEKFGLDPKEVRQKALSILGQHDLTGYVELSIAFVDLAGMKRLSKKYRKRAKATAVLTFSQLNGQVYPTKILRLGDLVICPEMAKKENLELSFLIEHGLKSLLPQVPTAEGLRVGSPRRSSGLRKSS